MDSATINTQELKQFINDLIILRKEKEKIEKSISTCKSSIYEGYSKLCNSKSNCSERIEKLKEDSKIDICIWIGPFIKFFVIEFIIASLIELIFSLSIPIIMLLIPLILFLIFLIKDSTESKREIPHEEDRLRFLTNKIENYYQSNSVLAINQEIEKYKQDLSNVNSTIDTMKSYKIIPTIYCEDKEALLLIQSYFEINGYDSQPKKCYDKVDKILGFRRVNRELDEIERRIDDYETELEAKLDDYEAELEEQMNELKSTISENENRIDKKLGRIEFAQHLKTIDLCDKINNRYY